MLANNFEFEDGHTPVAPVVGHTNIAPIIWTTAGLVIWGGGGKTLA